MRRFAFYVALAVAGTLPGLGLRLAGAHTTPLLDTLIFGAAILSAGFLLSWGAEAAEEHASRGLIVAVLALITVLPEYAVDLYYSFQAGRQPGSEYVAFAAANMTGANRLLIGVIWPLVVLLFWWRTGRRSIALRWENTIEISFLALATLYSFVITLKERIDLLDTVILIGLFGAYIWRVSKVPRDRDETGAEEGVGPAAVLETLPRGQQYAIMAALALYAILAIFVGAEPFAEALVATGETLGVDKFLLIQWLAPLSSEAPATTLAVLLILSLRATVALGSLISDKINQWTLLVGMIPLAYSLGAGSLGALPLDARQREEFFLTAAQSLFAVALLLGRRLSLTGALALLGLFLAQFSLGFLLRDNEAQATAVLTTVAWIYLVLALALLLWNRRQLLTYLRVGLLNRPAPEEQETPAAPEIEFAGHGVAPAPVASPLAGAPGPGRAAPPDSPAPPPRPEN